MERVKLVEAEEVSFLGIDKNSNIPALKTRRRKWRRMVGGRLWKYLAKGTQTTCSVACISVDREEMLSAGSSRRATYLPT